MHIMNFVNLFLEKNVDFRICPLLLPFVTCELSPAEFQFANLRPTPDDNF